MTRSEILSHIPPVPFCHLRRGTSSVGISCRGIESIMFSGPMQYLEVYLPSPTTVSFTVTTRRPQSSKLRFRVGTLLRHAFRMVVVYFVLAANIAKARDIVSLGTVQHYLNTCLKLSPGTSLIEPFAQRIEWWILAPLSLIVVYLCLRRDYVGRSFYSTPLPPAAKSFFASHKN